MEIGERMMHGNFSWGYIVALGIIWTYATGMLTAHISDVKEGVSLKKQEMGRSVDGVSRSFCIRYILLFCYILNTETLPYEDVKGYLLYCGYTEEEYDVFEKKRAIESEYYIGEQY